MTRRKRNEPIIYDNHEYDSIRQLADECFEGRYNEAYQTVFRYEKRRDRAVIWKGVQYASLAEMGRALGLSRERCRQLVNKAAEDEQAQS